MSGFVVAAMAMLVALVPCGIVCRRGQVMDAVVAYELVGVVTVMVLVLLAEGFGRSGELELALTLAVLALGSGLVFVRSFERWLR